MRRKGYGALMAGCLVALASTDAPAQQAAQLLGPRPGYVHPFLGVTQLYTDNLFNRPRSERTELTTVFSPGVWFAVPAHNTRLIDVQTLNVAPGGLAVGRFPEPLPRRYQAYLLYQGDYEGLFNHPEESGYYHRADALFQYNLRGGLNFEVSDQYQRTHEPWSTGISDSQDKYWSNLGKLSVAYDTGRRMRFGVGYTNHRIEYAAADNADRDRQDHLFSGSLGYRLEPKTWAFLEYERIYVGYDEAVLPDSRQDLVFGGLEWNVTQKSRGRVRAGYGRRDQDRGSDVGTLVLEGQAHHHFTPKTSLRLVVARRLNESPIPTTGHMLSQSAYAQYTQRLTAKLSALASASYTEDDYRGALTFGGVTRGREDEVFTGGLGLQYEPRNWLQVAAGYERARRDSNFEAFDYGKNTIYLRLTGGI
ncbi:MAG: outer membrane beta-barrel protein [Deferrisomatales bacterium]